IGVGGSVGAPDVQADLQVERAVVRPAVLPAQGSALKADPSIVVVGGPAPHETPPETPSFVRALRLAVAARIQRNAWVRRADADIELGGELKVTQAPGEAVHIAGAIRLLRGWYVFQGRRFTLEEEGTITFKGATPPIRPSTSPPSSRTRTIASPCTSAARARSPSSRSPPTRRSSRRTSSRSSSSASPRATSARARAPRSRSRPSSSPRATSCRRCGRR